MTPAFPRHWASQGHSVPTEPIRPGSETPLTPTNPVEKVTNTFERFLDSKLNNVFLFLAGSITLLTNNGTDIVVFKLTFSIGPFGVKRETTGPTLDAPSSLDQTNSPISKLPDLMHNEGKIYRIVMVTLRK